MFTLKSMVATITAGVLLSACSGPKTLASANRSDIKGNWTLNTITYDNLPSTQQVKITLLDEGTDACLAGSTWKFPNNGNGTYTINSAGAGCTPGERSIVWSHRVENGQAIFQFKRLTGGVKAKNVEEGYRFKIIAADDNMMHLQSEVLYDSKPVFINYMFSKS